MHFLPIALENEIFITDDNSKSFCVCCYVCWKLSLDLNVSHRVFEFFAVLSRQKQTLGTVLCNLLGLYLEKNSTLQHCKTLFGMPWHLHKPLKILLSKVRVVVINLRVSTTIQHHKHVGEITVIENWWVVFLVSRFICLKSYNYPARFLWGWFHRQSPGEISRLWDWDRVTLNHSVTDWETWFWLNCFVECKFFWSFGSTWGIYQASFDKTSFPASAALFLKIASL